MFQVTISIAEQWDEQKEEFIPAKEQTLSLEHSLVSLSKWESKWCKPFLSKNPHTREETIDYIRCMTITQNVDPELYQYVSDDVIGKVNDYIGAKMTATWFSEEGKDKRGAARSDETITSELIYYWMIAQNIPFECQKWHLNRLLTLIRVCSVKNAPSKKMSMKERLAQQHAINASRRKSLNTKG